MDRAEADKRIAQTRWYHEIDFGDGLRSTSADPDVAGHRLIWRFIEKNLEAVDFQGKTVLDIGCWDGYWSFYAERRGAKSVLATDDRTQNWADGTGLLLARELLGSSIEVDQDRSIYQLEALGRRFDVILCLGVYYHLVDPIHAFAQIRHCCHDDTVVVLEGNASIALRPNTMMYGPAKYGRNDDARHLVTPTPQGLAYVLQVAYLCARSQTWLAPPPPVTWRTRLKIWADVLAPAAAEQASLPFHVGRLLTVCMPFRGANPVHHYRPPFGLHRYDTRFERD